MTIDEAYNTCFGKPYIVPIDKREEARNIIRDLIEEVKQYREVGTVEECRNSVLDIDRAYNKAIDDFVKWIDNNYDTKMYMNASYGYKDIHDFHKEFLSEQLMGGGENDNSQM